MSTFNIEITGRNHTVEKIDQNDAPMVFDDPNPVNISVENSMPERSVLDQHDDRVIEEEVDETPSPAPTNAPAPTPEPAPVDDDVEEEPEEEVEEDPEEEAVD